MALPPLTPEQRSAALEKAAASRRERGRGQAPAQALRRLPGRGHHRRQGQRRHRQDAVSALLESMPGVGRVRARQIMEEVGISESRRVRGLGQNQVSRAAGSLRAGVTGRSASPSSPVRPPSARGPSRPTSASTTPRCGCPSRSPPAASPGPARSTASTTTSSTTPSSSGWPATSCSSGLSCTGSRATARPARPGRAGPRAGRPALLEIDLQGARQVREAMPEALFVFLAPPTWDELVRRLVGRGTEDEEERGRPGWPPRGSSWPPPRSST